MLPGSDADRLWHLATGLALARRDVIPSGVRDATWPLRRRPPPLVFVTDPERTPAPWQVAANLPEDVTVIFRTFGQPDARDVGHRLRQATRGKLLVSLDLDLARAIGADGVHLPQAGLHTAQQLRRSDPGLWISGSFHADADPVLTEPLDFALIAPVFAPGAGSRARPVLGPEGFDEVAAQLSCPALALGGVTLETAPRLVGTCAHGFAAIGAIQSAFGVSLGR